MVSYQKPTEGRPDTGVIQEFDYIRFYVQNAKQAASFYTSRFGFKPIAYMGLETGNREYWSYVVSLNKVTFVLTSPLKPNERTVSQHIKAHGDAPYEVAFTCDDVQVMMDRAQERGAEAVSNTHELTDDHGTVTCGSLQSYGDCIVTLVQRSDYHGVFLPGFQAISEDDPINELFDETPMTQIDHVVGNQPEGELEINVQWYEKMLDLHKYWSADENIVFTKYSSLRATFMANWDENVIMTVTEPAAGKRKSQIQEFIDFHGGPGVQHIAILTDDLVGLVSSLRKRGCRFLNIPDTYYDNLKRRLENCPYDITSDVETLKENKILLDYDEDGWLIQIFTECVQDRPCLFLEFIERHKSRGFGAGNFKELFKAIEQTQKERGNLV